MQSCILLVVFFITIDNFQYNSKNMQDYTMLTCIIVWNLYPDGWYLIQFNYYAMQSVYIIRVNSPYRCRVLYSESLYIMGSVVNPPATLIRNGDLGISGLGYTVGVALQTTLLAVGDRTVLLLHSYVRSNKQRSNL